MSAHSIIATSTNNNIIMAFVITHETISLTAGVPNTIEILGGNQDEVKAIKMLIAHRKAKFIKICDLAEIQPVPEVIVHNARNWVNEIDDMFIEFTSEGIAMFNGEMPDMDFYRIAEVQPTTETQP